MALALVVLLLTVPAEAQWWQGFRFRWVVSTVVTVNGVRTPKVGTLIDPARMGTDPDTGLPTPKTVLYTAVISDGLPGQVNGFCLALIAAKDMTNVDADTNVTNLFETDSPAGMRAFLNATPSTLGWTAARTTRLRNRLQAVGVDTSGMTMDTPLKIALKRIAQRIDPRVNVNGGYFDGVDH